MRTLIFVLTYLRNWWSFDGNYCRHQGLTATHGTQAVPALSLAHDITQAEGYAFAVPQSLWRAAVDVVNRSQHPMATGPLTAAELDMISRGALA